MEECYIVVHRNYADGCMAHAFRNEEDARKDVEDDKRDIVKSLLEQGYTPRVTDGQDRSEVYVPDSGIYYEWEIIGSSIQ